MGIYNGILPSVANNNQYQISRTFSYGTNISDDVTNFAQAKSDLDTKNSQFSSVPDSLKRNLALYIKSAGINTQAVEDTNNPLYKNVYESWTNTNVMIKSYQNLNQAMANALKEYNGLSSEQRASITGMATSRSNLEEATKKLKESKKDLDIATSRQESVTKSTSDHSYIQGFAGKIGFTRPLKPTSVALLMGLGFFIFFVTCLILKDYFTTSADIAAQFFSMNEIIEQLSSSTAKSVGIGIVATFIVYAAALYIYFYVYNK
jgi:hypothetical protein